MTLREAAERTSRSITTLRRYIRSGRLRAEKRYGRFGPEYFVSAQGLAEAGLDPDAAGAARALARRDPTEGSPVRRSAGLSNAVLREIVPLALYQELQMKHEQLLVQYGMVRAGGLRVMELRAELEARQRELKQARQALDGTRDRYERETASLRQQLRRANLELQGRSLEVEALQEKVRALEMLTRNAVTNEAIDRQFVRIRDQSRRVREAAEPAPGERPASRPAEPPASDPDH